ncbi:amino acid--[acyl-carrier-protein] ligase [Brevibacillus dissolubilis]|uniref:amino acid--[acyl-carrier-protein] ligase n=1 Tax=Brevibacillus dissolubilis TaxID=1844116 RepID=UPI001115B5D3|nr:amino acid--[acyl-carrier-protein] ligase [Brevibacillus dissolubilis]
METTQTTTQQDSLLERLFAHGHLLKTGVDGVYGRGGEMHDIIEAVDNYITRFGRDGDTEVMMFPPVMSRASVMKNGYMSSFPHLLGSIHAFTGNQQAYGAMMEDINSCCEWGHHLSMSDVVLTPAACYPIYPTLTGNLPEFGRLIEVASYCFRHEPSQDPARMQSFRMHEFVRVGAPEVVQAWREGWIERAQQFLQNLGLTLHVTPANDPFFGAGGRLLKANQKDQGLKFELVVQINPNDQDQGTAVISCNYHQDHFTSKYEIMTHDGQLAHTSCIGFGVERIVLALLATHGMKSSEWPAEVRKELWP